MAGVAGIIRIEFLPFERPTQNYQVFGIPRKMKPNSNETEINETEGRTTIPSKANFDNFEQEGPGTKGKIMESEPLGK